MNEEKTQIPEYERQIALLRKLNRFEEFQLWRDLIVKPIIEQIEGELLRPCELDEANLKAKLMHLNSMKHTFYTIFEVLDAQNEVEKGDTHE